MSDQNHERLLRAIRCLQLIQRTNAPKSSIFKAAGKALAPLMQEQSTLPPLPPRPSRAKLPPQNVGPLAGNHDPRYAGMQQPENREYPKDEERITESLPLGGGA